MSGESLTTGGYTVVVRGVGHANAIPLLEGSARCVRLQRRSLHIRRTSTLATTMTPRNQQPIARSKALDRFETLLADVDNLIDRHQRSDGTAGRPSTDEGPLSRAAVLTLYAAWEVYAEESLIEVVEGLASRPKFAVLPAATRDYVGTRVNSPWDLAGEGWRTALVQVVSNVVRGDVNDPRSFGINDASPRVIVALQRDILGESPFVEVRWTNQTNSTVRRKLAKFVALRGEIAHTGRTSSSLWHGEVKQHRDFISRLAKELDYRQMLWLLELEAQTSPRWDPVRRALADGNWHSSKTLRSVSDVPAHGRQYREHAQYLERCIAEDLIERRTVGSTNQYRLRSPLRQPYARPH